jgi:TatA/E family protein of Tat protein translocase
MNGIISNSLAFGMPMGSEWLVIGLLGLLIFGKRLPEVGRAVGTTFKQFREGMNGVKKEISDAVDAPTVRALLTEPDSAPAARTTFQFDPYTGKPMEETSKFGG